MATIDSLKAEANDSFAKKQYEQAKLKYTEALGLNAATPREAAILYANRSACNLLTKSTQEAIVDARKATQTDPSYVKAWARLGNSEEAIDNHGESIAAWNKALSLLPSSLSGTADQRKMYKQNIALAQSRLLDPEHMSAEVALAMARAHDIVVSPPLTRERIWNAYQSHPKCGDAPLVHLLVIPEDPKAPLRSVSVKSGPTILNQISKLVGTPGQSPGSAIMYSQDQLALLKGNPNGVGVGRLHFSYEAYMDDFALTKRRPNARAKRLLHGTSGQPLHGTIVLFKTIFLKRNTDKIVDSMSIIGFERITEEFLKGEEWKTLRNDWVQTTQDRHNPMVIQV